MSTQVWNSLYFLKWVSLNVMSYKTFSFVWNVFDLFVCLEGLALGSEAT